MGIYAAWVAPENSFASSQPFVNEKRDVVLLFSGECFADPETRTDLQQKGHQLGQAAGSWLVHLYEEEGDCFFEKLNGLFSGLIIDKRQNKAYLFNDRYGVERIYWHETEDALFFASEAKALLRVLPELREFDQEGVTQFVAFGWTLEGRTLFRGVRLLPTGSVWSFESGDCRKQKYFSPAVWESQPTLTAEAFHSRFQETFKRTLPRYFESGSKIGISLTAGLDSRMIMACLPQAEVEPICYTFSGEKRDTLDMRLAARVAEVCGLKHQILRLGPDFFSDFASHVDRTVYATDGYLGSLGAHEIYFNNRARALSPVRLTGVFGGEILRGVSMFWRVHRQSYDERIGVLQLGKSPLPRRCRLPDSRGRVARRVAVAGRAGAQCSCAARAAESRGRRHVHGDPVPRTHGSGDGAVGYAAVRSDDARADARAARGSAARERDSSAVSRGAAARGDAGGLRRDSRMDRSQREAR